MADAKVIRFRFQGVEYRFDGSAMTGKVERELWKATSMSLPQLFDALSAGASFGFAALLWLARKQAGEQVTYDQVEAYIDATDVEDVDLEMLGDDEEVAAGPQL